jgi:hypothetical protein
MSMTQTEPSAHDRRVSELSRNLARRPRRARLCVAVVPRAPGRQHGRRRADEDPTQLVVLDDYRAERRCGQAPIEAAQAIRDSYARVIARQQADGITPTRAVLDRFRVAEQWVTTVVQRDIVRLGRAS